MSIVNYLRLEHARAPAVILIRRRGRGWFAYDDHALALAELGPIRGLRIRPASGSIPARAQVRNHPDAFNRVAHALLAAGRKVAVYKDRKKFELDPKRNLARSAPPSLAPSLFSTFEEL